MYEEKEEEGISLFDLLKVAFGRKILLLIITLSITLVGVLFVKFYYNKNKTQYYVNYTYVIPGIEEGKYIDDSKFNYQMLISPNNLKAIKASNEDFSSINIDKMVDNDGISMYCDITKNQTTNEVEKMSFNISAKTIFFKSAKQANAFIHAVADQPYTKTLALLETIKYNSFLSYYETSSVYDTKAECLLNQYKLLQTQYSELIQKYGDQSLSDGNKISHYLNELNLFFKENSLESLLPEIKENGYVKNYTLYEVELKNLEEKLLNQQNLNQAKIDKLQEAIVYISNNASNIQAADLKSYNDIIATLSVENAEISKDLEAISNKLSNKDNTDATYQAKLKSFDDRIEKYNNQLNSFTEDFKNIIKEVVSEGSYVSYSNNTVRGQGGIKLLIAAPALLVFGCFAGCVVNVCLDHKKLSKKEDKEEIKESN